jgi:cysteine sulfinate desulfinase/cysteine desulfurase-like protein
VPESMGMSPENALSAVRISTGHGTRQSDIAAFLSMLREAVLPLVSLSRGHTT